MTQHFRLKFPRPGIIVDDHPAGFTTRLTEFILVAVATGLLVVMLLAAELRLTPEQRMDLLEVTYASP